MKKTKIICTLGPASEDPRVMKALIKGGMDVARFNFSHGTHDSHKEMLDRLKAVRGEAGVPVASMMDTKGPEIRTGLLKGGGETELKAGQTFTLTTRETEGDSEAVSISYRGLPGDLKEGDRVLLDDGLIELKVKEISGRDIICRVVNGGMLGERKGVNIPNVKTRLPAITDKDKEDILFAAREGFDFIALSFVRSGRAVEEVRRILAAEGSDIKIIAKIENAEGIENLDEIIRHADGVMVARGDMGVEIPPEEVPHIQKMIVSKANAACKSVIIATQMLDSMIRNPRPTRAEVTDVANAIYDGADAVMLSGETASGSYPAESLRMMVHIAEQSEKYLNYNYYREREMTRDMSGSITNAVCFSSVSTAESLGARAIIAPSISGFTTRMLSKYRTDTEIIGLSPVEGSVRQMQLLWGVRPVMAERAESTDELIAGSLKLLKERNIIKNGDKVVVTAGVVNPTNRTPATDTNIMRVIEIGDIDTTLT